jgi:hypothetical protein
MIFEFYNLVSNISTLAAQQMVILNFSEPFKNSCSMACRMLYLFNGFLCRQPSMNDFADSEIFIYSGKNIS